DRVRVAVVDLLEEVDIRERDHEALRTRVPDLRSEKLVGVAAIEQVGQRIPGRLPFELFRLRAQIARALLDEALEAVPHRRKLTYHEHAERQDHEEKRERRRIHS